MKRNLYVLHLALIFMVIFSLGAACHGEAPLVNSYLLNTVGASDYQARYWNPHAYNLKQADWDIRFTDRVIMHLHNKSQEFGHIACGAWWTPNFIEKKKRPLKNVTSLKVSVDVRLTQASYSRSDSILRMAVAAAFNRAGTVRYMELDFWDSPKSRASLYPGNGRYFNGVDEYSYGLTQVPDGRWVTITNDCLPYLKECWGDVSRAALESVYVVIESDCRKQVEPDTVTLEVRNLKLEVSE